MVHSANKDITQIAGHDLTQTAAGDFTESANNKTEIVEGEIITKSAQYTEIAEKININSTSDNISLLASKSIIANSGEKSNFN